MEIYEEDIIQSLLVLNDGGVLLYPTDTIWGLGCDATNEKAVQKIYDIKQRMLLKSLVVLVADEKAVLQYVAAPDLAIFDFLEQQKKPTTVIFKNAIGLANSVTGGDGSIAIRIVQDDFCRHLLKRFKKPIVSTSANISGEVSPQNYSQISEAIKNTANYIVQWRQNETTLAQASQIIKWKNGVVEFVRK